MPEPVIRRAGPEDAAVLSALGARTFADTFAHLYPPQDLAAFLADAYGLERTKADLANPAVASWLVEVDGEAVGYATAGPCSLPHADVTPEGGELKRFYFLKPWQGSGFGARLFPIVIDWLQRDGPRDVWIGVWSENHGAQRFYVRQGFEKVGEYGFVVGQTVDHEFILRKPAAAFAAELPHLAQKRHNPA